MAPKQAEAKCLSLTSSSRKPSGTTLAPSTLSLSLIHSVVFALLLYDRRIILCPPPHSGVLEANGPCLSLSGPTSR